MAGLISPAREWAKVFRQRRRDKVKGPLCSLQSKIPCLSPTFSRRVFHSLSSFVKRHKICGSLQSLPRVSENSFYLFKLSLKSFASTFYLVFDVTTLRLAIIPRLKTIAVSLSSLVLLVIMPVGIGQRRAPNRCHPGPLRATRWRRNNFPGEQTQTGRSRVEFYGT